jgi:preprotein translocase subunit SecG
MVTVLTVITALVCVLLMFVILIQNPKGGGVDSTFGGQSANQMLGAAKSADFVEKLTWALSIALFIMCIITTLVVSGGSAASDLPPLG